VNKIQAKIIADSLSPQRHRLTSFLLTVPQIVVKELLRHRMFSFSSSSMRAIPFNKVLADIKENMFVPLAFQSHHTGMQGTEYLTGINHDNARDKWIESGLKACDEAERLYNLGVTKQLCSRMIEPFGYAKILVTATEFENFFNLRCPQYEVSWYPEDRPEALEPTRATFSSKRQARLITDGECSNWCENDCRMNNSSAAEIHIQALAEAMWDAYNESMPNQLFSGDWHLPFGDKIDVEKLKELEKKYQTKDRTKLAIKVCVAKCARLSYTTHDGKIDYEKDIALHDQLIEDQHFSPLEHCCRVMSDDEYRSLIKGLATMNDDGEDIMGFEKNDYGWCNNFRSFIQYRYLVENEIRK